MRSLVLALVAAALPLPARANPVDAFGFGARAAAMGGAQTAATMDGSANHYNPGALAKADDLRIDLGYQFAAPRLLINGGDLGVDSSRGLVAALCVPGQLAGVHLAIGVGLFLPDERITRARTMPSNQPRFVLYDNRPQRLFLGANLALRLGRRLFVGAGIAYMSRTEGSVDLRGRLGFPDAEDSDFQVALDVDLVSVRTPQAGILARIAPWLDIGLAYRGGFVLEIDQGFALRGDVGPAGAPIVDDGFFALHSAALDLFQPEAWAAGFAARLARRLLLAGDVTWHRWARFRNPAARITVDYDLKDWSDLVSAPEAPTLPKPHFHDVFTARLAIETLVGRWAHSGLNLRAGYAFEPSPAPEQRVATNFVDNDKHTFSIGAGLELSRVTNVLPQPFDIDVFLSATVLPSRPHRKLSPVDPVGDYVSEGWVFASGLTLRFHL